MTSFLRPPPDRLAPHGVLRAAINLGNPVLAQPGPAGSRPTGVSVDLVQELGRRTGLAVHLDAYQGAREVVEAAGQDAWDVAFLAIDPARAAQIVYTDPYVAIEGTYLVPSSSRILAPADADAPGMRIAVGQGAAYDLFLSRTLQNATVIRCDTSHAALECFLQKELDAAAGVRQTLKAYATDHPGLRVLDDPFMAILQALALPTGHRDALGYVREFVDEMKVSGFIHHAMMKSRQEATEIPPGFGNERG